MRFLVLYVLVAIFLTSTLPTLAASSSSTVTSSHPNVHQVNLRLKAQWKLIQQGFKSGKLSKDQANSLRASLKLVRQQEVVFFKQNGNHELTSDQKGQLNSQLDKNTQVLGETADSN